MSNTDDQDFEDAVIWDIVTGDNLTGLVNDDPEEDSDENNEEKEDNEEDSL